MGMWSRLFPLLILGGFAAAVWWWNRRSSPGHGGVLNVVRRAALLRGAVLAVIEVGGRHYLVGATEQRIELLTEIDEESLAGMDAGTDRAEPWMDLFARARNLVQRDDPGFDSDPPR